MVVQLSPLLMMNVDMRVGCETHFYEQQVTTKTNTSWQRLYEVRVCAVSNGMGTIVIDSVCQSVSQIRW